MATGNPTGVAAGTDAGVLQAAATAALEYAESIDDRLVVPDVEALAGLASFDEALPDAGADPLSTLRLLHDVGSPATLATTGPRYFGFVIGSAYPVALGSAWLLSAWDQNAALPVMSPVAAKLHDVARKWLVDLLRLAADTAVAFVTGATVANASCLAAGRDALLARLGWDAQAEGPFGAPAFVTYDCGIAFVRQPADLRRTFAAAAGYLPPDAGFEAMHHTPQSSQRARQIEVWSVLRTLGRQGVAHLVAGACHAATTIAERLHAGGLTILNDVVLNQVLVRMVDGPTTEALVAEVHSDGRI